MCTTVVSCCIPDFLLLSHDSHKGELPVGDCAHHCKGGAKSFLCLGLMFRWGTSSLHNILLLFSDAGGSHV